MKSILKVITHLLNTTPKRNCPILWGIRLFSKNVRSIKETNFHCLPRWYTLLTHYWCVWYNNNNIMSSYMRTAGLWFTALFIFLFVFMILKLCVSGTSCPCTNDTWTQEPVALLNKNIEFIKSCAKKWMEISQEIFHIKWAKILDIPSLIISRSNSAWIYIVAKRLFVHWFLSGRSVFWRPFPIYVIFFKNGFTIIYLKLESCVLIIQFKICYSLCDQWDGQWHSMNSVVSKIYTSLFSSSQWKTQDIVKTNHYHWI